jgi:hypothetical protein
MEIIQVRIPGERDPSFFIREILTTIAETQIDPDKIIGYTDPNKTPSQSLKLVMERMPESIRWKIGQKLNQTNASVLFPKSMEIWGEVIAIGVATRYILLAVHNKELTAGQGTHPFSGSGWDLDKEKVRRYAEGVKAQIENARELLTPGNAVLKLPDNEEKSTHLIGALCYLKVKEALSKAKIKRYNSALVYQNIEKF